MIPMRVIARTPAGFAASDPWSPTLDGILAYEIMRERLGDEFGLATSDDSTMQAVEGLPLAVERHGEWWWYACSSPLYAAVVQARRYYHRRFDAAAAETFLEPRKAKVSTAAGPYKNARLSHLVTVTNQVTWHAIGEPDEVSRLLNRVRYIGAGIASGMGRVNEWRVVPDEASRELALAHRPLPVQRAQALGITGPVMRWGIRPPVRIPGNRCDCVMPRAAA